MNVALGISIAHNGSVALICDGEVKIAIQAERISRRKRKHLFLDREKELMKKCVQYCLKSSGFDYKDIKTIGISTHKNLNIIDDAFLFEMIGGKPENYMQTYYVPHHYSHMEYIAHYGKLKSGIVLVIDGSGSSEKDRKKFNIKEKLSAKVINYEDFSGREVISAYWFDGNDSKLIYRFSSSNLLSSKNDNFKQNSFFQSIGHYWEWASLYCCGSLDQAGKVMGLAAFGKNDELLKESILSISDDGKLNINYDLISQNFKKPNIFGEDLTYSKHHQDIAYRVQLETEEVILKLLKILKDKFQTDTLYLSGGVALNVVVNEKIKNSNLFRNLILNGSVEDNGTAIGAGIAASLQIGTKRKSSPITDYYGKVYKENEIIKSLKNYQLKYKILTFEEKINVAAELISKNKVLGWFQGKSEFGPRALGNRSILANPTSSSTKHVLDHYMKLRDRYRPYAPVVIEEEAYKYFDVDPKDCSSPVMMRNVKVISKKLPAITHIDRTARLQTVKKVENIVLYNLLKKVNEKIGVPILLNTSFNRPGEPIVETPSDALTSFSEGSLDYLFIENILISRN